MTFREHLRRASATVRSWPPWKQALLGGDPISTVAGETPGCRDCHRDLTKWYIGNQGDWRWFCPHCYDTPAGRGLFPTREHMDVRHEDLAALQEDWKNLWRDGAASRGETPHDRFLDALEDATHDADDEADFAYEGETP